uniref:DNA repair protein REV1 n=1 Tax=Photinus pyralis TaxID=7054 RepID=A0A1Y1LM52_PHOPY
MTSRNDEDDNGFAEWGGYMAAKKAKLVEQYEQQASSSKKQSDILTGVAIYVNGYTSPSAEELKILMSAHGGVYHTYQMPKTTHIVASILPNAKVKQLGSVPIVKATWISDSIAAGALLDHRKYLLYTGHDDKQPKLDCVRPKTLTAADPGFLSEFYNNSRLHLISTLGAEYKQLVNQLREKSNGVYPGRERLRTLPRGLAPSERVVMHIDMDCFFVSVGLRSRPQLRGRPVAVTHGRGTPINRPQASVECENELVKKYFPNENFEDVDSHGSMAEVASCSYEARQCGVRNGMLLGNALKICSDLKTIPYDFEGYREVSTALYKTIAEYTLDIEAVSCDEMYVDVTPILAAANITVEDWATHIRKEVIAVTGCPCSAGFGANRLQARLANKRAKPAGQFYLRPDDVETYMAQVSLSDLPGVGSATVAKLTKMGLHKCGDLQVGCPPLLYTQNSLQEMQANYFEIK